MSEKKKCDSSQGCDSCGESNTCSEEEKQAQREGRVNEKLSHIDHRIMVMSGKGGVGKSTVAANLAVSLARRGYEVGILDGDVHGPNIPKMLGLDKEKLIGTAEGMLPVPLYPNLKVLSMAFMLPNTDAPVVWRRVGRPSAGITSRRREFYTMSGSCLGHDMDTTIVGQPSAPSRRAG